VSQNDLVSQFLYDKRLNYFFKKFIFFIINLHNIGFPVNGMLVRAKNPFCDAAIAESTVM
jgi:hypothetical protein